jgi:hypothetical protein
MASASALPGQALYPVKLAVEQLRVTAVRWSSTREANERIKIAHSRLDEFDRLVQLNAADRIPPAIVRLKQAYVDAQQAVEDAVRDTGDPGQARALHGKLAEVTTGSAVTLHSLRDKLDQGILPAGAGQAIADAIQQAPVTPALVTGQPTATTNGPILTTPTGPQTTTVGPTTTAQGPTTTTPAPTTTTAPTTTEMPTTTVPSEVDDSPGQGGSNDSDQGSSGGTTTTLP